MNLCDIAELRGKVRRQLAQCRDVTQTDKLGELMHALDDEWAKELKRIRARDEVEDDWVEDQSWVDDAWSERVYVT